jgi:hypothetical protein
MTLAIIWYALHGHHHDDVAEHHARAPWYLSKTNPSTADMLAKLRRTIIAVQYHPAHDQTPTPAQITQVQHAWAAAELWTAKVDKFGGNPQFDAHAPGHEPDPRGGRPRADDRVCFGAIMMWSWPGSRGGMRLREWERAGVWARLHAEMLRRLNAKGAIDWQTGVVDGSHIRALFKGPTLGPRPLTAPARAPSTIWSSTATLAISLTGGHRNDVTQLGFMFLDGQMAAKPW